MPAVWAFLVGIAVCSNAAGQSDDHGDTPATATPISLNTPIAGALDFFDIDYFRIKITSAVNARIFTEGNTDTFGRLYGVYNNRLYLETENNNESASNANFLIHGTFHPRTYIIEVIGSTVFVAGRYTLHIENICQASEFGDLWYGCQWHLKNTGQNGGVAGEDINVESVWETYKGDGVHIAVVDRRMHFDHDDLKKNVDKTLNHDYTPEIFSYPRDRNHGTAVSGLIAARDNGLGVRGVAPRATIYGYNLRDKHTMMNEADAMTRNIVETYVSNNSWGPSPFDLTGPGRTWEMAIETGVNEGADGKGIVYVWSAGNGGEEGDNANYNGFTNYYAVTAVCAVNNRGSRASYSEPGANLWVCAPGGQEDIVTTDNAHNYIDDFGGTSAAAPIVSGVVALVRQANSELSWRDVKLILAASARQNDSGNSGWEAGAYQYQSASERYSQRYRFNHEYGFGVVDAQAAVNLAQDWKNVPLMKTAESATMPVSQNIEIASDIEFIEFVEINSDFEHPDFSSLDIQLISPAGAVSELTVSLNNPPGGMPMPILGSFRLGSAKHLGENPSGTWQLRVSDRQGRNIGSLNTWSLKIYGHSSLNPAVMIVFPEVLTEENLDGSELVVTITDAVWSAALAVADFSLAAAPAGVTITGVERNTDTQATLTLAFDGTDFDDNAEIRITALATAHSGNDNLVVESPIIVTANHEATGAPVIEGIQQVGARLTATVGNINDEDGLSGVRYSWQWQVSRNRSTWIDISGADTADFIPALTHQGQFLRVVVSFMDDAGFMESRTSASVGPVLGPPTVSVTVPVTLTEINLADSTLVVTITNAVWDDVLAIADFSLAAAPAGVRITGFERNTDTQATLTLEFDGTDFDDNAEIRIRALATAYSGISNLAVKPILSANPVTVVANRNPVVSGLIVVPQAAVASSYRFTLPDDILTDPDNDVLIYELMGLPSGLVFSNADRTISGIPMSTGNFTITWLASDPGDESATVQFDLTVKPDGFPLVVNPVDPQNILVDTEFRFSIVDHQVFMDSVPAGGTLTYTVMNEPSWLMLSDNNDLFSGTPRLDDVDRSMVTVIATDTDGNQNSYVLVLNVYANIRFLLKVFLEGAQ